MQPTKHLPSRLDPQMDHPPPPVLIDDEIGRVKHSGRIQRHQRDQIGDQNARHAGETAAVESGENVPQNHRHHRRQAEIGPTRRFDIFAPFVDEPQRHIVAVAGLHEQKHQNDNGHGDHKNPKRRLAQARADQRRAAFVLDQPIGRADHPGQHPHDHRVGVQSAHGVKIEKAEKKVGLVILHPGDDPEKQLRREQRAGEKIILDRESLPGGKMFHRKIARFAHRSPPSAVGKL